MGELGIGAGVWVAVEQRSRIGLEFVDLSTDTLVTHTFFALVFSRRGAK